MARPITQSPLPGDVVARVGVDVIRPIVGDLVDFHYHTESVRCVVVGDKSSAFQRHNYDPTRASLVLVIESGAEGQATWVAGDSTITLVETDWTLRLFAIVAVIAHTARLERNNRFAATDRRLDMLRTAGLL